MTREQGRLFEVSKVRLGADGQVSEVLWGEVDARSDLDVGARVRATAAEVIDAIQDGAVVVALFSASTGARRKPLPQPDRAFVVVEHADGREHIAFADGPSPQRNLADIACLDG